MPSSSSGPTGWPALSGTSAVRSVSSFVWYEKRQIRPGTCRCSEGRKLRGAGARGRRAHGNGRRNGSGGRRNNKCYLAVVNSLRVQLPLLMIFFLNSHRVSGGHMEPGWQKAFAGDGQPLMVQFREQFVIHVGRQIPSLSFSGASARPANFIMHCLGRLHRGC